MTVAKVAAPASDPSLRKLLRSIQFQGTSVSISVSRSLQNKHKQRKAREADTSGKQARRKAKKVKRQASKQQSAEQQHQAAPSQPAQPEIVGSQLAAEQQRAVPDDEPLLEADFPLPGSFQLPTVIWTPVALAQLNPTPSSAAKSLGTTLPVVSSSRARMLDAVSPLAGKRRGPESMSDAESSGVAESPCASTLAIVPFTPDDSCAPTWRRSSREHKKPRPYYAGS